MIAAGPLASIASPRKKPKRTAASQEVLAKGGVTRCMPTAGGGSSNLVATFAFCGSGGQPPHPQGGRRRNAPATVHILDMALNGLSRAAAGGKTILAPGRGSRRMTPHG